VLICLKIPQVLNVYLITLSPWRPLNLSMEQLQVIMFSFKITINVPVVFMARYVMVLRSATSLRGALERVGPENRDFWGPEMARAKRVPFGLKKVVLILYIVYYTVFSVIAQLTCCFLINF
jgi:hypothetical protein